MLVLALLLATHSASQGKSRFDVEPDGSVAVEVQLGALDLPELCNVDLSVTSRRAEQEDRLDECVQRGFPLWVRVSADGATCPFQPEGWRELLPATVPPVLALSGRAQCPIDAREVTIDWGFFRGTPLDHTSVARIRVPHADDRVFLFSKRASKLTLEVTPRIPWTIVVAVVGALAALVAGVAAARRITSRSKTRG